MSTTLHHCFSGVYCLISLAFLSRVLSAEVRDLPKLPENCNRPAYLVVVATISDPIKSRVYVDALRASGLYPALEGFYITFGQSPLVLEGSMFKERPIVIAKFPCSEAAQRFWYSDMYQKSILPLRDGAGVFDVAIFEERLDSMQTPQTDMR
jgi:uncharacterized protein (DUF1330 family)